MFYDILVEAFRKPLPGETAYRRMWAPNRELLKDPLNNETPRNCAVAAVFFPDLNNEINLLLIKRTPDKGHHSGQFSFPGGKSEISDSDLLDTALREFREETGAETSALKFAGVITPLYIPVSNFLVHPHVFYAERMPETEPSQLEVEFVLSVPFSVFSEGKHISSFFFNWKGTDYEIPCYRYGEHIIWGATAMMISELVELLS